MRYMGRAARMDRHHARHKKSVGLNLVSLMDIFTILVFFLLVNSSEVEVLPNTKDVQLPESIAETRARESVVVLVTDTEILVQGRVVSRIDEVLARDELVIPELKAELIAQAERALLANAGDAAAEREVTIMGDKEIPYHLLKRVMATCTDADYGQLSLAVLQKPSDLQVAVVTGAGG
jgi:biopolymer transport protein TolR